MQNTLVRIYNTGKMKSCMVVTDTTTCVLRPEAGWLLLIVKRATNKQHYHDSSRRPQISVPMILSTMYQNRQYTLDLS